MTAQIKLDIYFIGSSVKGLNALCTHSRFNVLGAFCLESRVTPALVERAKRFNVELHLFKWHDAFCEKISRVDKKIPFFIYQLDMLIPERIACEYPFFNVHRGNLMTNRGPNPDVWPILLGFKTTTISLHRINGKIDAGQLISAFDVTIESRDDSVTVKNKMESHLNDILGTLYEHLTGALASREIINGRYYPWVTEQDFTLDLINDTTDIIGRKIRCQRQYFGAILNIDGHKKYVDDFEVIEPDGLTEEFLFQKDFVCIRIKDNGYRFKLNRDKTYTPMATRQKPVKRI